MSKAKYVIRVTGDWPGATHWYVIAKKRGRETTSNSMEDATRYSLEDARQELKRWETYTRTVKLVLVP